MNRKTRPIFLHPFLYLSAALIPGWLNVAAHAETPLNPHPSTPDNISAASLLAQEIDTETPPDLTLTPRFGGQFTTGPEAGYNSSYGSIYTWIPFAQTPGNSVAFAEGRFNIATEGGRLGGNLLLGYRNHIQARDLVWGAYLGYDIRSDNSQTYHQLSTGADIQTGIWETRLNAYFPIADTTNTVVNRDTILNSTATNPQFVGNLLQFTQTNTVRRESIVDSALTGFDLETGAKLYAWEGGDLRGYLGTYVYGGENVSTFVGFRSRLIARPTPNTNVGLTLQTDGEFGTNLILSFGASFGGTRSNQPENTVVNRLGEGVQRQSQIALTRRSSSSTTTTTTTTNATNPATGQPWFFRHVTSTGGNGNGTFESPYNTISEALNGIATDGNQIVYVQGSGTFTGNLNIPSNVQLLSTGPTQQIATTTGNLTLPLSGSGNTPTINGQVIANANSVFDGFNVIGGLNIDGLNGTRTLRNLTLTVNNANESGISCSNISGEAALNLENVTINVNGANSNGIRCTNVTGNLAINGGTVTKNNNQFAIFLQDITGSVALAGMNITSTNGGLLQGNTINNLSITNSTLVSNNAPGNGIELENVSGTATIAANTGSQINTPTGNGARFTNSTGTINFSGFAISNSGDSGIEANAVSNLTVENNTINSALNRGIELANSNGTLNIANNTITNTRGNAPTGQGIRLANVTGTANITGNTITETATDGSGTNANILLANGQGIVLANTTGNLNLNITGSNQINNNYNDAILIGLLGNAQATIDISGNTINNNGNSVAPDIRGDGIGIGLEATARINGLTISNNTISGNGDDGIDIRLGFLTVASNTNSTAQITNAVFSNNTITLPAGSNNQGINFQVLQGTRLEAAVTGNTLTNGTPLQITRSSTQPGAFVPTACLRVQNNSFNNGNIVDTGLNLPAPIGTLLTVGKLQFEVSNPGLGVQASLQADNTQLNAFNSAAIGASTASAVAVGAACTPGTPILLP